MPTVIEQPTAEAAFEAIKSLPAAEKLKLAGLIINGIAPELERESAEEEADFRLITQASLRYAAQSFGENEESEEEESLEPR